MSTATKIEWTGIPCTFPGPRKPFRQLFLTTFCGDHGGGR
jgi:hypothetical protein